MRYTDIPLQIYTPFTSNLESLHPVPIDRSSVHPPPLAVQFRQEMWRG